MKFYTDWANVEVELGRLAKGTVREYTRHLQGFLQHCGDVQVDQLLPLHLMQFGTTRNRVGAVHRLFNWAVDQAGLLDFHKFKKVKLPPLGERQRIVTHKEQCWLFRAANRPFRFFLLAQRESIARPQEVRELEWEQWHQLPSGEEYFLLVDFKGKKRRKNKNAVRIIPVTPRLSRLLARLRKMMLFPVGRIFVNTKGRPWSANAIRCEMRNLRRRVGLGPDKNGENVVCYTMRHTAATKLTIDGMHQKVLQELMGHASPQMTARYQHVPAEDLLRAFAKVVRQAGQS